MPQNALFHVVLNKLSLLLVQAHAPRLAGP